MCCNSTNNNGNVQGNSGRRRCCCNRDNNNVESATVIAVRGPGCINGTGRCLRRNESVQGDSGFDNDCSLVSPDTGNGRNRRNRCQWCFRCLEELLSDFDTPTVCPR